MDKATLSASDNIVKLSVVMKKIRALVLFDLQTRNFRVVDCSRSSLCRTYISKECPPYCPAIVAVKDFVYKRRVPKGDVKQI